MQRRVVLSLLYLGVTAAALAILFLLPQYATYALYGFLAWFIVSLALVWGARGASTAPGSRTGGGAGGGSPLASSGSASPIPFCAYCAADLPAGASRCPACGHPVLTLA